LNDYYVPSPMFRAVHVPHLALSVLFEVGIIKPILLVRKLRFRKLN
jgi:hypothetical protein